MDKKIIDRLVVQSVSIKSLDEKKIRKIADRLTRKQLKGYIYGLKRWRQKNTVTVESAGSVSEQMKRELQGAFPGKRVVFIVNPDLIIGTRITDNDMIYETNLKDTLQHMQRYIKE